MSSEVTFVTAIEGGHLEFGTLRLVESLRKWGGRLADSPFLFVKPRPGPEPSLRDPTPDERTGRRLPMHRLPQSVRLVQFPQQARFVFARPRSPRPRSCAGSTPTSWCSTNRASSSQGRTWTSSPAPCPWTCTPWVSAAGTMLTGASSAAPSASHSRLSARSGSTAKTWSCAPTSTAVSFASESSSGFADAYYRTVLAALDARITSSTDGIFMHEQMSLTIAAKALGLRIRELSWTYNFSSYNLESTNPRARDAAAGMVVFHYHGYFFPEKFGRLCELIADRRPDRLDFMRSLGSYDVSRLGPWKRLRTRLRKEVRRRQEKRYVAACRTIETPSIL